MSKTNRKGRVYPDAPQRERKLKDLSNGKRPARRGKAVVTREASAAGGGARLRYLPMRERQLRLLSRVTDGSGGVDSTIAQERQVFEADTIAARIAALATSVAWFSGNWWWRPRDRWADRDARVASRLCCAWTAIYAVCLLKPPAFSPLLLGKTGTSVGLDGTTAAEKLMLGHIEA